LFVIGSDHSESSGVFQGECDLARMFLSGVGNGATGYHLLALCAATPDGQGIQRGRDANAKNVTQPINAPVCYSPPLRILHSGQEIVTQHGQL
jgi:hypothetical protein